MAHAASRPWPWLFAIVYALHLLDEGLVAGGLPDWSTVLALPLATRTLRWARAALPRRLLLGAALCGMASFQAPWDLLVRWVLGLPVWVG